MPPLTTARNGFWLTAKVPGWLSALRSRFITLSLFLGTLIPVNHAWAQVREKGLRPNPPASVTSRLPAPKKPAPKNTIVEMELLQDADGGGLHAQKWLKVLEPLDVSLRVHRPIGADKPEIKEREVGNTRYVTAIGTLDRSGNIFFPDRSFSLSETTKLAEWIQELRTYGMKGTPVGQPLWGLSEEQFAKLYDKLVKPIDFNTEEMLLKDLISKLPLPPDVPVRWSSDAKERLERRGAQAQARHELNGFSTGLVLAVALNENGLGYRPNRTSAGSIELLIETRDTKSDQWPIGWPVKQQIFKAVPKLFEMAPIELSDVELADVIGAISDLSETPILIDYAELESRQIDLEKIKVSFPRKMTSWGLALRQVVVPQRLTREFWQDEAGRVFVWITTTRAGRARDER
ncbi:hypothetical protein [Schlesneria sp. T3-172]|uniref:hypothetical protein n=1 Tax=Schlesneria sphaerica TaxID=3373610 RepID=UPI0037CA5417